MRDQSDYEAVSGARLLECSREEYFAHPALSQSQLKLAWHDPQLYEEIYVLRTRPAPAQTPSQKWGCQCEEYIRCQGPPENVLIIPPEALNADGHRKGGQWTDFKREHHGKDLVTREEFEQLFGEYEQVLRNVRGHDIAAELLLSPQCQWSQRILWMDEHHEYRAELDVVRRDLRVVVDVKTSRRPDRRGFLRDIDDYDYDLQAVTYLEAVEYLYGGDWEFLWVAIKNAPPYRVHVHRATLAMLDQGAGKRRRYLAAYNERLASGIWRHDDHGRINDLYPYHSRRMAI